MTHRHIYDTQATIAHLSQTLKAPRINTVYATIAEQARRIVYLRGIPRRGTFSRSQRTR